MRVLRLGKCVSQEVIEMKSDSPRLLHASLTRRDLSERKSSSEPKKRLNLFRGWSRKAVHKGVSKRDTNLKLTNRNSTLILLIRRSISNTKPLTYCRIRAQLNLYPPASIIKHKVDNPLSDD